MNKEQQRTEIAKFCGWNHWFNGWNKLDDNTPPLILTQELPNYPEDLNAMHEAEKLLLADVDSNGYSNRFHRYTVELHKLVPQRNMHKCYSAVHATAEQRAEAFLRTMGKWID